MQHSEWRFRLERMLRRGQFGEDDPQRKDTLRQDPRYDDLIRAVGLPHTH